MKPRLLDTFLANKMDFPKQNLEPKTLEVTSCLVSFKTDKPSQASHNNPVLHPIQKHHQSALQLQKKKVQF